MKVYRASAQQVGRYWHIEVPEINRATQARNLREADAMVTDLIAIMTDANPDSFSVDLELVLPPEALAHKVAAEQLRSEAAAAQTAAALESRRAALALRENGYTLRDIGEALGVSYQRAHQLVQEAQNEPLVS